jgi:hypothetical protein
MALFPRFTLCCQIEELDHGGKEKDHREEEAKYTASNRPTAKPKKR